MASAVRYMNKTLIKIIFLLMLIFFIAPTTDAMSVLRRTLNNMLHNDHDRILGVPREAKDLPPSEPLLPGHSLLRPALGMLKSALKFPHRDVGGSSVVGNPDNIALKYGGKAEYMMYSDFRRDTLNKGSASMLLDSVLDVVQKVSEQEHGQPHPEVLLALEAPAGEKFKHPNLHLLLSPLTDDDGSLQESEDQNEATEILDDTSALGSENGARDYRRKRKKHHSSDSSSASSSSDDHAKNPGNPFTMFKDRYRQNYMWNFNMDGDHMNINPYGPAFSAGPSGGDIFFARKWWYFNEDDFKPF